MINDLKTLAKMQWELLEKGYTIKDILGVMWEAFKESRAEESEQNA